MRKIVLVLLLAALAMLAVRLAYHAPVIATRSAMAADELSIQVEETSGPVFAAPLMYAGIRG